MPSVGTRVNGPGLPGSASLNLGASQVRQAHAFSAATHLSCVPPTPGAGTLSHKDTQGCHRQPGSTFSLLVSSTPRAPWGASAPTPGAPGPGSLGQPLSGFHPKPNSREGLGERRWCARPKTGGFSQKIQARWRGSTRARGSSPRLGDGAAGELGGRREPPVYASCVRVRLGKLASSAPPPRVESQGL